MIDKLIQLSVMSGGLLFGQVYPGRDPSMSSHLEFTFGPVQVGWYLSKLFETVDNHNSRPCDPNCE